MDDMKMQHASDMYAKLCESMDLLNWKFTKKEENLLIECSARGDDLPIDLFIKLNTDLQLLSLILLNLTSGQMQLLCLMILVFTEEERLSLQTRIQAKS